MGDLYLLIRPRLQGLKNRIARPVTRKRTLILGGLGLIFCGGLFFLSCRILIHFQSVDVIGDLLARQLMSMVLLTFFSLLVFSHIITALSNLYLSKDLELCHSTPVRLEELFMSRALYTLVDSSWMLIAFGLPIFMAYAYVYRPGPGFYFSLIHLNLALALIAGGTGILVTMVLVYVFPAQRTRDLIVLLSILMLAAIFFLLRFMRPERLVNPESFFTVMQYVGALKAPQSPYLPTKWITDILWGALAGSRGDFPVFEIMLTWTTAGAIAVINIWVARMLYFEGFSKSQEAKRRRHGGKTVLDLLVKGATIPFGRELGAVISKDIRTFFRDNTQWSQLLLLAALVLIYIYNFSVLPLDKSPIRIDFLQNELAFLNMGLAGFVLAAVSARFVFTAVSAEGEAYWILRSSPLGLKLYLWGKYLFFLLPILILGEVLIIVTNIFLDVTPFMMLLSTVTMFFMVFGIVALGIGFGAMYPNFRHDNITQVSTGFGGLLYMIMSAIFVGTIVVLEAGPVYFLFMADARGDVISVSQWFFIGLSFLAVLAINIAAVLTPMNRGLKALGDYEL
jgi:ABC-2 type transport system permease protein